MMKSYTCGLILAATASALDNGLGMVPQMGWNTWNKFGCDIAEDTIETAIEQVVALGLD